MDSSRNFGDLASAFKTLRRPRTAAVDLLRTAEIETVDLPAARNSSSRRSSSCVQRLFLFPTMLRRTEKSINRSRDRVPVGADQLEVFGSQGSINRAFSVGYHLRLGRAWPLTVMLLIVAVHFHN